MKPTALDGDNAESISRILSAARDYPYAIPTQSFVYRDGDVYPFEPLLCKGRTPVLAIGSNQSPARLTQKFPADTNHLIPVQRARLKDFDVVYSAHISRYGAVPAMLQHSPGSTVDVAVTWLNQDQLRIMNDSEVQAANYAFAMLEDLEITLDGGDVAFSAHVYVSSRGHLSRGGPLALTAIRCESRRYRSITTSQALDVIRDLVAPDMSSEAFIVRLVRDDAYRLAVIEEIGAEAEPFAYPYRIID